MRGVSYKSVLPLRPIEPVAVGDVMPQDLQDTLINPHVYPYTHFSSGTASGTSTSVFNVVYTYSIGPSTNTLQGWTTQPCTCSPGTHSMLIRTTRTRRA